jgi:hypothetical protein
MCSYVFPIYSLTPPSTLARLLITDRAKPRGDQAHYPVYKDWKDSVDGEDDANARDRNYFFNGKSYSFIFG